MRLFTLRTGPEGFRGPPEPADASSSSAWIDFYHRARLSADAAGIFHDLTNPSSLPTGNAQRETAWSASCRGSSCDRHERVRGDYRGAVGGYLADG